MARPKRRKSRPAARQESTEKSAGEKSANRDSAAGKPEMAEPEASDAVQSPPSGRQKLVFALAIAAFFVWLACLAVMALMGK